VIRSELSKEFEPRALLDVAQLPIKGCRTDVAVDVTDVFTPLVEYSRP